MAGYGKYSRRTVEEQVAEWLKELGMIESFELRRIAPNRKDYELRVRHSQHAAEVLMTDVGFGVSQILPVVAVARAHPQHPPILNAVNSDWWHYREVLQRHGVDVEFICPDVEFRNFRLQG